MPHVRPAPTTSAATREKIKAVFTVVDGVPVWQERTADFYRSNFPRAFDPDGAAEEWNAERAGKPPRWQYINARGDFVCNAWQRQVGLREVCETFSLPYLETYDRIVELVDAAVIKKAKKNVLACVELVNGEPVWKKRTRKTHPKTAMEKLDAFNSEYAGMKLRLRDGKYYLIRRLKVQREDLLKWLKEG